MKSLNDSLKHSKGVLKEEQKTKKFVVNLFNVSAVGFYAMFQANEFDPKHTERLREILKTDEKHVFFDKEVDTYVEKHKGWDNSEFFMLDLHTGYVSWT